MVIDGVRLVDKFAERLVTTYYPFFPHQAVAGSCLLHKAALCLGQLENDPLWLLTSARKHPPAWFFSHMINCVIDCGWATE